MRGVLTTGLCAGFFVALAVGLGCSSSTRRSIGYDDPKPSAKADASAAADALPDDNGGPFGTDDDAGTPRIDLDGGCATARATAKQDPVYLHIVLDASGSMGGNKWTAATGALNALFDQLGAKTPTDDTLGIGMFVFGDSKDQNGGVVSPERYDVWETFLDAVTSAQAQGLKTHLSSTGPSGGTPLREAMEGQIPLLQALKLFPTSILKPNGKKVLLVMTDGVPNGGATAQQACVTAAKNALAETGERKVTTFAVGIGDPAGAVSSYDPAFMSKLAEAGGTGPAGCDPAWTATSSGKPCHFQVTPGSKTATQLRDELIAALDAIRGAARGCEFVLDRSGGTVDTGKVNVLFTDGSGKESLVPKDGANGWRYDNEGSPTKVVLVGAACNTFTADTRSRVDIVLGCKTQVN